jgi:hypothetical protein
MSRRSQFLDGDAHLLHELELIRENPVGKRESVRDIRWWLFGVHHKMERKTKCTERKKCNKDTETDVGEQLGRGTTRSSTGI